MVLVHISTVTPHTTTAFVAAYATDGVRKSWVDKVVKERGDRDYGRVNGLNKFWRSTKLIVFEIFEFSFGDFTNN